VRFSREQIGESTGCSENAWDLLAFPREFPRRAAAGAEHVRVAKGERSAVSIAAERAATSREACLVSAIFSCRPAAGVT